MTIPTDFNFLWSVFVEEKKYLHEDIRKPDSKDISEIRISDKGLYAFSFLERFPNNWEAARFVETKFWRNLLEHMNKIDEQENQKKMDEVKKRLSKRILPFVENFKNDPDYHINWLSSLILNKSRELKEKSEFIKYDELFRLFAKEREDSLITEKIENYIPKKEDDESELQDGINRLLEYSIFFQGISPRCTHCGSIFWYSSEEIKDFLICKGCMKKFRLEAETKWSYKLNTLILNAVCYHGVIPVIWAQNELLEQSKSCIFVPGLKFYRVSNPDPLECDLVTIRDGNIVLVELKTKAEEYGKGDLEKLAMLCKIIMPQKAMIGSIYGDKSKLDLRRMELKRMIDDNIDVEILYPSEHFFKPSWWL